MRSVALDQVDLFLTLDGREAVEDWTLLPLVRVGRKRRGETAEPDLLHAGRICPIVSERLRDALPPEFEQAGQFLPVEFEGRRYFAFNCLVFDDVLDWAESSFVELPQGRKVSACLFRADATPVPVFRIAGAVGSAVFLREDMCRAVTALQPRGLELSPGAITLAEYLASKR